MLLFGEGGGTDLYEHLTQGRADSPEHGIMGNASQKAFSKTYPPILPWWCSQNCPSSFPHHPLGVHPVTSPLNLSSRPLHSLSAISLPIANLSQKDSTVCTQSLSEVGRSLGYFHFVSGFQYIIKKRKKGEPGWLSLLCSRNG